VQPRFLPYTTKSALPSWPVLVRLYLRCPPLQWLLGRQMFIVAVKPGRASGREIVPRRGLVPVGPGTGAGGYGPASQARDLY
jgi:hypothetical protein